MVITSGAATCPWLPSPKLGARCGLQWHPSTCSAVEFLLTRRPPVSAYWDSSLSIIFPPNLVSSRIWDNKKSSPLPRAAGLLVEQPAQQTQHLRTVSAFLFKVWMCRESWLRWPYQDSFPPRVPTDRLGPALTCPGTVTSSGIRPASLAFLSEYTALLAISTV